MFGLFHCSYDYYEWLELICVANTEQKLLEYGLANKFEIVTTGLDEHNNMKDRETYHYYVTEIKNIS